MSKIYLFIIRVLTIIVAMKVLQLNITSINNSIKAPQFYQEQNDYDLITLQETDTQKKDLGFKILESQVTHLNKR